MDELLTDLDRYRFVLTRGLFVFGDGFEIRDEGALAVLDPAKQALCNVTVAPAGAPTPTSTSPNATTTPRSAPPPRPPVTAGRPGN